MKQCITDENGYMRQYFDENGNQLFNICEILEHKIIVCEECKEEYCSEQYHLCDKYLVCEFCNITFTEIDDYNYHNKMNLHKHLNIMFKKMKENTKS